MKFIPLFALMLCTVSACVAQVTDNIDNKPPWCEVCIDLAEKLKKALKGGEELKEVAHNFCNNKMPSSVIEACHMNVDTYWEKVMESVEENIDSTKICIKIC